MALSKGPQSVPLNFSFEGRKNDEVGVMAVVCIIVSIIAAGVARAW